MNYDLFVKAVIRRFHEQICVYTCLVIETQFFILQLIFCLVFSGDLKLGEQLINFTLIIKQNRFNLQLNMFWSILN